MTSIDTKTESHKNKLYKLFSGSSNLLCDVM